MREQEFTFKYVIKTVYAGHHFGSKESVQVEGQRIIHALGILPFVNVGCKSSLLIGALFGFFLFAVRIQETRPVLHLALWTQHRF